MIYIKRKRDETIKQQKEIIVYYEKALKPDVKDTSNTTKTKTN